VITMLMFFKDTTTRALALQSFVEMTRL